MTLYARLDELGNKVEVKDFDPKRLPDPFISHKGILWVPYVETQEKIADPDTQTFGDIVEILTEGGLERRQTVRQKTAEELQADADRKALFEAEEQKERLIEGYDERIKNLEQRMAALEEASKKGAARA